MSEDNDAPTMLLGQRKLTVALSARHAPRAFFQSRPGLHVWSDFAFITSHAEHVEAGTVCDVVAADLARGATDDELEAELPRYHEFCASTLCAILAEFISRQAGGLPDALESSGRINLFYARSCVVTAYWNAPDRSWRVGTWLRGDALGWKAGGRVFFPDNVLPFDRFAAGKSLDPVRGSRDRSADQSNGSRSAFSG
jgi:hypothetical protein